MYEVNRSVVIVKPKQPFADWLATLDVEWPQYAPPSLMQVREDCNAFFQTFPTVDTWCRGCWTE